MNDNLISLAKGMARNTEMYVIRKIYENMKKQHLKSVNVKYRIAC